MLRHRKRYNQTLSRPIILINNQLTEVKLIDIWLQRLSYIAQFGLFLLTIGTIYFTVIPLYQKALLDEAIAKQEVKLKETNEILERTYERLRTYIVNSFVSYAGMKCTGLIDSSDILPNKTEKPNTKKMLNEDNLFEIDIPTCLINAAHNFSSLQYLQPDDRVTLEEKIHTLTLSGELSSLKQQVITEYEEVPNQAAKNFSELKPPDGFQKRMLEILEKLQSPEDFDRSIYIATIDSERLRIRASYQKKILELINTLRISKLAKEEN
ncbi:hypothetical protein [Nitrosomonas communis]|uniref:Uncharacterized protein n=1 Tax=Nitrosomonas communis TaxID=44574 RepID=A0A1I4NBL9_9PROT|nr:hypothetical protein [Nitrosomonas communis]SFM12690.1 hypothetical protein SAMN05421863_101419 [Nitrosomonas communis]